LTASHLRYQSDNAPRNEIYYPPKRREEEPIYDVPSSDSLDAIVTRNHYGGLVLNAHHALFIDVDMPGPCLPSRNTSLRYGVPAAWRTALDDLNTVLSSERHTGFRIYRTAAGFRILATTHEYEPGSASAIDLMTSVGADSCFILLSGSQNTFRARLTPKPWRCGATRPPNQFPRQSADEQRWFVDAFLRRELPPSVGPSAEMSFRNNSGVSLKGSFFGTQLVSRKTRVTRVDLRRVSRAHEFMIK
jgi:hypothetical protein